MDFSDALRALKGGNRIRQLDFTGIQYLIMINGMCFALTTVGTYELMACFPEEMVFAENWEVLD